MIRPGRAFHPPTRGPRVGSRGCFSISWVGSRLFLGIHCKARVGSGRRRRRVAKGWGPGTRERQYASRDTIPQDWGERTHSRTQAQLRLHRSSPAAAELLLPTQGSGVHTRRPELPTLGPFSPFFASGVDSRPKKSKNSLDSRPSGLGSGGETRWGFYHRSGSESV